MRMNHGYRFDQRPRVQATRPQPVEPDPEHAIDGGEAETAGALATENVCWWRSAKTSQFQVRSAAKPANEQLRDRRQKLLGLRGPGEHPSLPDVFRCLTNR